MLTTTQEGHIYWLHDTPESRGASFDIGKLNHPVLVLGAERAGSVQALVITSLGNTALSDKFPNPNDYRRRKYLPLKGAGAAPHPDNGILLSVRIGRPPMLTKPSYVNLEPFTVEVRLLKLDRQSTSWLESDTLELLIGKLLELHPTFELHRERSVVASSSSQSRSQRPPARPITRHQPSSPVTQPRPSPVTRHQPSSPVTRPQPSYPVTRPQPPAQQSALLPQRAYSDPYGTTARQDYREDLEWNAPRPPPYSRPYGVVGDYHDSEGESDCLSGWDILGYLGIAAGIFISVRYLFR